MHHSCILLSGKCCLYTAIPAVIAFVALLPPVMNASESSIVSLPDWISGTRFQGYTNLQSLVKCLDHRDNVSDTACSQANPLLNVTHTHVAKHVFYVWLP